jgi:hypothetical protein
MATAVLVAIAASIGNLLQGWDNATIAGIFFIFFVASIPEFILLNQKRISFSLSYPFCARILESGS